MIALDSLVGELYIVNGQRQNVTPFSGAFGAPRRSARGRHDDTLFVLIDPGSSHSSAPDLLERIQQTYWRVPGSVTSALRTAIEAGNDWLVEHNRDASNTTHASITCAVLRGTELFIGQIGAANAWLAHQGSLQRFPAREVESGAPALGSVRVIEVRFSHAELHHGDVLLLTDAAFPTRMPQEAIATAIVYVGIESALNNLQRLGGAQSLTALAIEFSAASDASELHEDEPPVEEETTRTSVRMPHISQRAGAWAGALRQGVARGAGSVGVGLRTLFERTLPERSDAQAARRGVRRRSSGASALEQNTTLMVALAIGIPLIVAIFVTAVFIERSASARITTLLNEAQQLLAAGASAAAPADQRVGWETALLRVNEVLESAPDNAQALQLRNQAFLQLDRLDGTVRVAPVLMADFNSAGPHRLATQGTYVFVLDQAEGRADRLPVGAVAGANVDDAPVPALAKGITISGRVIGDLIDMTWVQAFGDRQKSALIILERGGLVEYDLAFDPITIPFADSIVPLGVRRLESFGGNLYALDANARQLWRYQPSGAGYPSLPEGYFDTTPPGIENASDVAIDGNVYLLETNGSVHKYLGGQPAPFEVIGLPTPIQQPIAIAVDTETPQDSNVYIADRNGARIFQLSPEGRFIRQIRSVASEFDRIDDLLVDEQEQRLYVISAGRLYSAVLSPTP